MKKFLVGTARALTAAQGLELAPMPTSPAALLRKNCCPVSYKTTRDDALAEQIFRATEIAGFEKFFETRRTRLIPLRPRLDDAIRNANMAPSIRHLKL